MPTYQYSCTDCGHLQEAYQSFSDDPLTVCAECGGRLRKVFNAVGVVFKGSGFYRTDSRSSGEKRERTGSEASGPGGSDGANGSNGSDGSKAAAKSGEKAGDKTGDKAGSKAGPRTGAGSSTSGSSGSGSAKAGAPA